MIDRIYSKDVRACGMCLHPGTKRFFEFHNLDYRDFIRNGIEVEKLRDLNDALAMQVIEKAEQSER